MGAIYPSHKSVSEILDDSAAKWDADGPVLRLIIFLYVQLEIGRDRASAPPSTPLSGSADTEAGAAHDKDMPGHLSCSCSSEGIRN